MKDEENLMSRSDKVVTFSSDVHEKTVEDMRSMREEVHAPGLRILRATGSIPDEVNVFGKRRVSRNSMEDAPDGKRRLTNGPALPWLNTFDATSSMAENVEKCFYELGTLYGMTEWLRQRYNLQIANSLVQDVKDSTPVYQMTQFESDNRIAKQIRLMVSGGWGEDATEDYDYAEAYHNENVRTDMHELYSLKGYRFIVGDQRGRSTIMSTGLQEHLGFVLPNNADEVSTREITRALDKKWHQFYLQVATGGRAATHNYVTDYWKDAMGNKGHVVLVPRADLIAETQVSIVYLTETSQVSEKEYMDFIIEATRETNEPITKADAKLIWNAMKEAGIDIGAQTRLPGYADLPQPGDIFEHDRHAWPIDHARFAENVIPVEDADDAPVSSPPKRKGTGWKNF
jgi:hypothetical protein